MLQLSHRCKGNKFTTQNLEVALPATVYFDEPPRNVSPAEADAGDPFCDGNTGYVKVLHAPALRAVRSVVHVNPDIVDCDFNKLATDES